MSPEAKAAHEALVALMFATTSALEACTHQYGKVSVPKRTLATMYAEAARAITRLEAMQEEEEGRMNSSDMFPEQYHANDDRGVLRFRENRIVTALLERSGFDLNFLSANTALGKFDAWEYQQLLQLIGYSVDGIPDPLDADWRSMEEEEA